MKQAMISDPDVFAAMLAAKWARKIGLKPGNYWEPALARNISRELVRLGNDANARAFVEAIYAIRLGLSD